MIFLNVKNYYVMNQTDLWVVFSYANLALPSELSTNKIYKSFAESTLVDLINRMQILVFPKVRNVRVKSFKYSMSKEIRKLFEGTYWHMFVGRQF